MRNLKNHRVIRNAAWIIGGKLLHMVLTFLIGLLTARYLGPDNYGLINYAAAFTSFFSSVCTLGINSILVKEFIDHPEDEGKALGTTFVLRFVSSLLSMATIVGIVGIIDDGDPLAMAVVSLYCVGMLFQIFDTLNYWFQAKLESKYASLASVAAYVVSSAYKLVLLMQGRSIRWFAVANSVDYIVAAGVLLLMYFRTGGQKLSFSREKAKALFQQGSSFIISGLMVSIYASMDKLMLRQFIGDAAVGHYSIATGISSLWGFLLVAVIDSLRPVIMEYHNRDKERYVRSNRQLYAVVFYISLIMSLAVMLLADPIVRILYGEAYLEAVQPLRIVVWYTTFSYLGGARSIWIVSENKQRYLKYTYACAAVLNVALNGVLIPVLGTSGAALASVITQMFTSLILPMLIPALRPNAKLMLEGIFLKDVFPDRRKL